MQQGGIRPKIYIGASGLFVLLALVICINRTVLFFDPLSPVARIAPYISVPFIFLYPVGFVLTWFVEQSMKVHFKHRILVWLPMAFAGFLYLYMAVNFFFKAVIL